MSEFLKHASETALLLDDVSRREFGAEIQVNPLEVVLPKDGLITQTSPAIPNGEIVPLGQNFDQLTKLTGAPFGVMMVVNNKRALYPGVITSRTSVDGIHFTYLEDPIDPANISKLNPIQKIMLDGGLTIQDKNVGSLHSHDNVKSVATEVGHTAMAMHSLTDAKTLDAINKGTHLAHDWSDNPAGIAPILSSGGTNSKGAFELRQRAITFKSLTLKKDSPIILIKSDAFEGKNPDIEGVDNSKLMMAIGIMAAKQKLGKGVDDQLLKNMGRI